MADDQFSEHSWPALRALVIKTLERHETVHQSLDERVTRVVSELHDKINGIRTELDERKSLIKDFEDNVRPKVDAHDRELARLDVRVGTIGAGAAGGVMALAELAQRILN